MQVHDVNDRAPAAEAATAPALPVRAFLSGRADDLVPDLLAYALYVRDREARGPVAAAAQAEEDPVMRFRREATADLTNFTYRFFHNQIEEIRHAAVRDHLGSLPRPPGFLRMVAASAVGVLLVGAASLWAMGQGGILSEMVARVAAAIGAGG
ncbi:hypothetical protein [Elioraea rosea]|uniref:hypothetical protein n=1 Tax=Elioraea rosea TaxID=2492390 RepID=UPI00118359BC|nr:hypothetical protein [Elioraea rosea]